MLQSKYVNEHNIIPQNWNESIHLGIVVKGNLDRSIQYRNCLVRWIDFVPCQTNGVGLCGDGKLRYSDQRCIYALGEVIGGGGIDPLFLGINIYYFIVFLVVFHCYRRRRNSVTSRLCTVQYLWYIIKIFNLFIYFRLKYQNQNVYYYGIVL